MRLIVLTRETRHIFVFMNFSFSLTLSRRRPLSYRNQFIDLLRKLMDWFLYDNGLRHERVKQFRQFCNFCLITILLCFLKMKVKIYSKELHKIHRKAPVLKG